jgi:tRNA(Arg) A34 adenosine deaminase TadA
LISILSTTPYSKVMPSPESYMREALRTARQGMESNQGGPFGAVVVSNGEIIGRGCNHVTSRKAPTAHAEVVAIREACHALGRFELSGCEIYSSCEPCPMCLGAIYWARMDRLIYAGTRQDAAQAGFDDAFLYREMVRPPMSRSLPESMLLRPLALELFEAWALKVDKNPY